MGVGVAETLKKTQLLHYKEDSEALGEVQLLSGGDASLQTGMICSSFYQ